MEPAFMYRPGAELAKFVRLPRLDADAKVDVHGNQVALLERSRCFAESKMTCTTCHDVHAEERPAAAYSEKCLACHKAKQCGEFAKLGEKIRENCVDCHMPVQESETIVAKGVKAKMRNHWIRRY